MVDVLLHEHSGGKGLRVTGPHIALAAVDKPDSSQDFIFSMDIDTPNCQTGVQVYLSEDSKQEDDESEDGLHASGQRVPPRKGSLVLIRARSMSKSESDGSVTSSPDEHMLESLVWRERDRVCLTAFPEKLDSLKGSPYVGTFHHGHGAGKALPSPKTGSARRKPAFRKSISDTEYASSIGSDASWTYDGIEAVEEVDEDQHRSIMKQALKLEEHVPCTPELCGIQGLLPRKSGVRVLEKIGEGSFGKIVKAKNCRNSFRWINEKPQRPTTYVMDKWCRRNIVEYPHEGETLVLKCIRSGCPGDPDAAFVQREIRIHRRCQHPNIVKFYGHYEHDQHVTLILGYVMGRELYHVLETKRRLPEHEALPLFLQMLGAVEHMHRLDIVHRDIKPHNVLVTSAGRVYLIDMGLSLDLSDPADRASWRDPMVGTMNYLAPEMHQHRDMGLPVDLWALGVLLYEAVCGFQPFQPHEVATMALEFPDAMWGIDVSPALQTLIDRMLDKNPDTRITAAKAMEDAAFTAQTLAEVAAALAAPQEHADPPASEIQATGGEGAAEGGPALKLQLTQSNSVDWTGQYYFNYCLATAMAAESDGTAMAE